MFALYCIAIFFLMSEVLKNPKLSKLDPSRAFLPFLLFPIMPSHHLFFTFFSFFFLSALIDIYEFDGQLTRFLKKISYSAIRRIMFLHKSLLQHTPVILMSHILLSWQVAIPPPRASLWGIFIMSQFSVIILASWHHLAHASLQAISNPITVEVTQFVAFLAHLREHLRDTLVSIRNDCIYLEFPAVFSWNPVRKCCLKVKSR